MTNFERVIELAGKMSTMEIVFSDAFHLKFEVDSYDIYEDAISVGDLEGNEVLIAADNIQAVDGDVVYLKHLPKNIDTI